MILQIKYKHSDISKAQINKKFTFYMFKRKVNDMHFKGLSLLNIFKYLPTVSKNEMTLPENIKVGE